MNTIVSKAKYSLCPGSSFVGYLPSVAALLLLISLLISARLPAVVYVLFIVALLLAALAVSCSVLTGVRPLRSAIMATACALAIVAGIASAGRLDGGYAYSGLPTARVTGFRGVVTADAQAGSFGQRFVTLRLQEVSAPGQRADAHGLVLCSVSPEAEAGADETAPQTAGEPAHIPMGSMVWGQYLSIDGSLQPFGTGGIAYRCNVRMVRHVGWHNDLFRIRAELRTRLLARIDMLPPQAAGLFRALFVGQREGLNSEELLLFRRAGAMHVLALSGMHLGIIATLILLALRPLIGRRRALIVALCCCTLYVLLVGLRPSLLRALLMFAIWGLSSLRGRTGEALNVLALTFILLVLVQPAYLHSLSFELSFVALAGILLCAPSLADALTPWLPGILRLPLAASIGALIASAPSLMLRFGVLYPIGLLSSILLAPLATIFIWVGILFLLLGGLLPNLLAITMQWLHAAIVGSARISSWAPALRLDNPVRLQLGLLIWAVLLVLVAMGVLRPRRRQPRPRPTASHQTNVERAPDGR